MPSRLPVILIILTFSVGETKQKYGSRSPVDLKSLSDIENLKQQPMTVITSQFKSKHEINGPLCMIGGSLLHMVFGTMYCWGNFLSYLPQNLQFLDGKLHPGKQPDALLVLPLTVVAQCIGMPLGPILVKKVGASSASLIGGWLLALGVFMASYAKSLPIFMVAYSLVFGFGIGLGYTAPMIAGWKWLPDAKGLVSGVVLMGYGFGGFIFNLVGTKLVNPKGLEIQNGAFPDEVYQNFPKMLRRLSVLYAILSVVGSTLITEKNDPIAPLAPVPSVKESQKENRRDNRAKKIQQVLEQSQPLKSTDLTTAQALRTSQFWLLWAMIACAASASLNVASIYKRFATSAPALQGDQFQALVGGLGAAFNGGGRLIWGAVSDKIGFKKSYLILTVLQTILQMIYPYSASSRAAFVAITCLCFFTLAGNFALIPPAIQRLFGPANGAKIYAYVFSAFGVASVGGVFMSKVLSSMGWETVFRVLASFSLLASILTTYLLPVKAYASSSV